MNAKFFVDTNVLFYAHDRTSGDKHARAQRLVQELWESGGGIVSTQVLQEFCVNVRRANRALPLADLRELIENYSRWQIVTNGVASVLGALELQERYQLSFWDALIVQAAQTAGAGVLYSEDLNDQQMYGSVRAVNPFRK
jgi:predicted nucleic acid-binding protein